MLDIWCNLSSICLLFPESLFVKRPCTSNLNDITRRFWSSGQMAVLAAKADFPTPGDPLLQIRLRPSTFFISSPISCKTAVRVPSIHHLRRGSLTEPRKNVKLSMIVIIVPVEQNTRMIFIALTGQGVNVGNGHHHVYKEKKYKSVDVAFPRRSIRPVTIATAVVLRWCRRVLMRPIVMMVLLR